MMNSLLTDIEHGHSWRRIWWFEQRVSYDRSYYKGDIWSAQEFNNELIDCLNSYAIWDTSRFVGEFTYDPMMQAEIIWVLQDPLIKNQNISIWWLISHPIRRAQTLTLEHNKGERRVSSVWKLQIQQHLIATLEKSNKTVKSLPQQLKMLDSLRKDWYSFDFTPNLEDLRPLWQGVFDYWADEDIIAAIDDPSTLIIVCRNSQWDAVSGALLDVTSWESTERSTHSSERWKWLMWSTLRVLHAQWIQQWLDKTIWCDARYDKSVWVGRSVWMTIDMLQDHHSYHVKHNHVCIWSRTDLDKVDAWNLWINTRFNWKEEDSLWHMPEDKLRSFVVMRADQTIHNHQNAELILDSTHII